VVGRELVVFFILNDFKINYLFIIKYKLKIS